MQNTFEIRSQIARLLSKENIDVIHGEYRTAFFDVVNRVLGLPNWKDKGKDVYDLLVGHEVGHALFTPPDGWHDSDVDVQGIPRSFLNIIEDIRIERKVQAQYPGLVGSFKRGYSTLYNENFFGTEDRDLNEYKLIDRINLKSKLGNLVDVSFSDAEMPLFDKAMSVETWEDVVNAAKAILEFMKEEQETQKPAEQKVKPIEVEDNENVESMPMDSDSDTDGTGEVDGPSDESESDTKDESTDDEVGGEDNSSTPGSEELSEESERTEEVGVQTNEGGFDSETDSSFRANESSLIDTPSDGTPYNLNGISRDQVKRMVIPYSKIEESRRKAQEYRARMYGDELHFQKTEAHVANEHQQFVNDNKKLINLMVKEFESRKAAFQYSRASTAKTGSLDVNKLHTYKYNEDIFAKVTRLADAKSHGLVMYIDTSGSMSDVIGNVIKQTLVLATFCKRVNIPFDVYGFTSGSSSFNDSRVTDRYGDIDVSEIGITHMLSSSMKKAQYRKAYMSLFHLAVGRWGFGGELDYMGGTPLNQTIMAAHYMIDDFKAKHKVDKVVAVFLTDGEGNRMNFGYNREYKDHIIEREHRGVNVRFQGKVFNASQITKFTNSLLENLRSKNVITVGIHLAAQTRDARSFLWGRMEYDKMNDVIRKYSRERSAHITNATGFDSLFLISARPKDLKTQDDEFSVDSDVTSRVLKSSFVKYTKSKKNNRIVMGAFAAAIA